MKFIPVLRAGVKLRLAEVAANGQKEWISFQERCSGFLDETLSSE